MTEQPDTTAIRAESRGNTYRYLAGIVMVLCDALDAAREDADMMGRAYDAAAGEREALERAGATALDIVYVDELLAKISELSARIAAALAACDPYERFGSGLPNENWVPTAAIRRALTAKEKW